jgi:subtilisin family serine protease
VTKPIAFTILALLLAPAPAAAASWAVGAPAGRMTALRAELPDATPLVPGRVLLLRGARPQVRGAAYVDDLDASRRSLAFANTEPDAPEQWYLNEDSAWSYWTIPPDLATVTVAVIDSGIDATHPEFVGRIAAGKSFVDGSSWQTDTCGHGTFVAGEIAANPYNDVGIAGIAFNAKLLVAKVVEPDCDVSTTAEIRAIIWAANHGARVINLSIGGVRDPLDPGVDTFSAPEEAAVEYAYSKGVLVVAAVGNATQSPKTPWPYADYPAALPHVLGVGAVKADGGVPDYSNRDERYVDMAAPGGPIFSTVPRNLIDASLPGCRNVPYSDCGPSDLREGIGTSFSAPQVSAAAALLIGADPSLTPQQVEWLLERSATDARATTGCPPCRAGRDSLTGWGTLDVESALARLADTATLPPVDSDEPNDDAGNAAYPFGPPKTLDATLDYWDDPVDVYSLKLRKGERLYARIGRGTVAPTSLVLWKPGTIHVTGNAKQLAPDRAARSSDLSGQARLAYRVPAAGTYYLEARIDAPSRALDAYSLSVALSRGGTN